MIIENEFLKATILQKGAELSSLKYKSLEYIWQADPKYWARHSPVLFPIVGRLKDHEYTYKDKTYAMSQHGFARHLDFEIIEQSKSNISLELRSSATTKEQYPFDFSLKMVYTLDETTLKVGYSIKNESASEDLFFSLGTHPAFNCPVESNQSRSDYALVFDKKESPTTKDKKEDMYIEKRTDVFGQPGILKLDDTLFDDGSLTFNPNPFSQASLVHQPTGKNYFTMTFKNYPYLGIWSPLGVPPFVCIEPWHGIADNLEHNKNYVEKEGIKKLDPNEQFSCEWELKIH